MKLNVTWEIFFRLWLLCWRLKIYKIRIKNNQMIESFLKAAEMDWKFNYSQQILQISVPQPFHNVLPRLRTSYSFRDWLFLCQKWTATGYFYFHRIFFKTRPCTMQKIFQCNFKVLNKLISSQQKSNTNNTVFWAKNWKSFKLACLNTTFLMPFYREKQCCQYFCFIVWKILKIRIYMILKSHKRFWKTKFEYCFSYY